MFLNGFIDFLHETDGLDESDNDLPVVSDVVFRQSAVFAVLEPLLADLVTADMEVPHVLGYTPEAASLRLVEPHGVAGIGQFLDFRVCRADIGG